MMIPQQCEMKKKIIISTNDISLYYNVTFMFLPFALFVTVIYTIISEMNEAI